MKARLTVSIIFVVAILLTALYIQETKKTLGKEESSKTTPSAIALTKHHFAEPHLGTVVRIVFYSDDKEQAAELAEQCFTRVRELNAMLSDYLPDSEVSRLDQLPLGQPHKVSDDLFTIVAFAQAVSEKTDGAFDITVGKHSKRWRNKAQAPPESEELSADYRDLILDHENQTITLEKPLMIDLGAVGKGYIADQLMLILKQTGITKAAVIIGGETVLADAPPEKEGWHIGIEDPEHKVIGKIVLSNTCVSTSGDSYQFFEVDGKRQAHVIDPKTKQGKTNRLNVTTIAPSSMEADAWATALRVLPVDQAMVIANKQPKVEALFIPLENEMKSSENFPELMSVSQ